MEMMINLFENMRAVLFDLDGTLVETNIDFALMKREVIALAEKRGIGDDKVEKLDILSIVDFTVEHLQREIGKQGAERVRQEAMEKLEQIEMEPCRNAKPIPLAKELLNELRVAGLKIGIVTRNCRNASALSLERTGIAADALLTRDDVSNTKPHPDHLIKAVEMLGVCPEEALMVGDHWIDIAGGKAAGMKTVGFLRPGRADDFFDELCPDLVVCDLRELLDAALRLKK